MKNRFANHLVLTVVHTQSGEDGIPCRFCMNLTVGNFSVDFLAVVSRFGMVTPQGGAQADVRLETSMQDRRGLFTSAGERYLKDLFLSHVYGKELPVTFFCPIPDGQCFPIFLTRQFDGAA